MSTPNPSSVITMLAKFRREQDRQDAAALKQLGGAYAQLYKRLSEKIELEATRIFEQGGENVSRVWVARRLESLRKDMLEELAKYSSFTEGVIDSSVDDVLALGTKHAQGLMDLASAGTRDFVSVEFGKLNAKQIDTIIAFLAKGSPLRKRIAELAGTNTEYVINQITEAIALGYNPYKTADNIKGYLTSIMDTATNGMASVLASAVRLTRTSQIWAYREATRANYQANNDVVTGWQWTATEDELTCTSCLSMHGTIHDNDEVLDDHWNGRCYPTPVILGEAILPETAGLDYFNGLSEQEQRDILGNQAWEAYRDGRFDFSDLNKQVDDPVFGTMRVTPSLSDLIGE